MSKKAVLILGITLVSVAILLIILNGFNFLSELLSSSDDPSRRPVEYESNPISTIPTRESRGSVVTEGPIPISVSGEDPSPEFIMARPRTNVTCRTGPSTQYPPHTYLAPDQIFPVDGRNPESTWWRLAITSTRTFCWVWSDLLDFSGDTQQVPELPPPPLPKATDTVKPSSGGKAGCWVIDQQHPNGYCRPSPCTPNDFPGTKCTPP